MLLLIPLACFVFIFIIFYIGVTKTARCWRSSLLAAALVWGFLLVMVTEILSVWRLVNWPFLLLFWILLSWLAVKGIVFHARAMTPRVGLELNALPWEEKYLLMAVGFFGFLTGLTALLAPPNNGHVLAYSMSRVAHWAQNQTLAHYPVSGIKHLVLPPGGDYFRLHFFILGGGDRFINFIPWLSMLGCLVGVSLAARQLGADRKGQVFSAVIAGTLPMGILQASGSLDYLMAAFWLVCFVCFFLRWQEEPRWLNSVASGIAAGLAMLTQGVMYLLILPFMGWFLWAGFRRLGAKFIKQSFCVLLIILAVNGAYYARNHKMTGHVFPLAQARMINETFGGSALASNVVRNIGLQLATPFRRWNKAVEEWVGRLHDFMGLATGDTRLTSGAERFSLSRHQFSEDHSGNMLHVILTLAVSIFFFLSGRKNAALNAQFYYLSVAAGFVLICLMLKWAPFHSRFHLAGFVLFAPFAGLMLSKIPSGRVGAAVCGLLIIGAVPWVMANESRPLVGRSNIFNTPRLEQYFWNNKGFQFSFEKAVETVKMRGCADIGFWAREDAWEYLFWILSRQQFSNNFRFEHVLASNPSAARSRYPLGPFSPCAIIANEVAAPREVEFNHQRYVHMNKLAFNDVYYEDRFGVFARQRSLFYMNRAITGSRQLLAMLQDLNRGRAVTPAVMKTIMSSGSRIQADADEVDIMELNNLHQGLGDHFRDEFQSGLEKLLRGFASIKSQEFKAGQDLMRRWGDWISQNAEALEGKE